MGLPMAGHLAAAGVNLKVWNRTSHRADTLEHLPNVVVSPGAVQAVQAAQIVIVMLSTGQVVDEVLFGPDQHGDCVADTLNPSSLVIVMSSIPVGTALAQAEKLRQSSIRYVDAPVSGGETGARAATLTIMAGGDVDDIQKAMPVLQLLGKVTRVGPVGSGQLAKLANQLIVGVTIGAVAEALILAAAGGADIGSVCQALQGGFADSTILRQHGARMVERRFEPGGHATTQLKDLVTARALADSYSLQLPFLELSERLYRSMCDHGLSERDHSALFLELERISHLKPAG